MTSQNRRLRVVVCGTTFGRVYLKGIARLAGDFELVGILARGSDQARDCARRYGVPCYTTVAALPFGEIDMACVVVRSAVVGGPGTALALELLRHGVHVLQEHPVHHDDLVRCLKAAQGAGCRYALNGFYPDLPSVRGFIAAARQALARSRAVYVDAACGINVLYPLVDILGRVLGGLRPWTFSALLDAGADDPLTSLTGRLGGVPLRLGIQNTIAPEDPDNSGLLLHRIVLCTENGTLMLPETHGPVLWSPRLYVERDKNGVLDMFGASSYLDLPATEMLCPFKERAYGDVLGEVWTDAIKRALLRFKSEMALGVDAMRHGQYCLTACRVWQELGQRLGLTRTVGVRPPTPERLQRNGFFDTVSGAAGRADVANHRTTA